MNITNHFMKRQIERNITDKSIKMVLAFGTSFGYRDGLQITRKTYIELISLLAKIPSKGTTND